MIKLDKLALAPTNEARRKLHQSPPRPSWARRWLSIKPPNQKRQPMNHRQLTQARRDQLERSIQAMLNAEHAARVVAEESAAHADPLTALAVDHFIRDVSQASQTLVVAADLLLDVRMRVRSVG